MFVACNTVPMSIARYRRKILNAHAEICYVRRSDSRSCELASTNRILDTSQSSVDTANHFIPLQALSDPACEFKSRLMIVRSIVLDRLPSHPTSDLHLRHS